MDEPESALRLGRRGVLRLAASLAMPCGLGVSGAVRAESRQRRVSFISQDFRNSGVAAVYRSFEEACGALGWKLRVEEGRGDTAENRRLFQQALRAGDDGVVLGGVDAADLADLTAGLDRAKPVIVGWHATSSSKKVPALFANVATDVRAVAEMAVALVEPPAGRRAGVVIINDSRFEFANAKTLAMREAIQRRADCDLLEVVDLPIFRARDDIPALMQRLVERWAQRWTHVLAINDIYFESMTFPLVGLGRRDVQGISAGDGSLSALSRVSSGRATQVAVIAEPMGTQGWQLADELWRAFTGLPPSGRVASPVAMTTALARGRILRNVDDDQPFRDEYLQRWSLKR